MIAEAAVATQENARKITALEIDARALAEAQRDIKRAGRLVTLFEPQPIARPIERAQRFLSTNSPTDTVLPKAVEWFLDNYYLIRRVARQVEEELPRGFVRHLPELASGFSKGKARIDMLAQTLLAKTSMTLDLTVLRNFVDAYQQITPLTIAELWALPTMLRATVLKHLLQFLNELHVPVHAKDVELLPSIPLEPGLGVERSIRTLRVLDVLDWKAFFESTNRVEAILHEDPTHVYEQMDFETCDAYRKVIEALAWSTGVAEDDVANLAIKLARKDAKDPRRGHVGYYLIDAGRPRLEQRLGFRVMGPERIRRAVQNAPTTAYLLPLAVLTAIPLLILAGCLAKFPAWGSGHALSILTVLLVALVPVSGVVVAFLHVVFARLLPPRPLPKLDFEKGLPSTTRTLVVMPTLLGRIDDVKAMLRQIELHYLSNPDPQLQFALLTDDIDVKARAETTGPGALLESASAGIRSLNEKHGKDGNGPFHLLHRRPHWNPGEERFMGWERKRGKLDELNRLLRGDKETSFSLHVGEPAGLLEVKFVLTLDSDTELPIGSAHRLVGLLAHPLNRAVFDADTGRVIAGYTIVQPRIATSPSALRQTLFSKIFAGDVGFDIYTHACSELYQDLFGSGIYVGKGIYDIDAFKRSVEGCAPENTLVSHDLFEGVHGRTALATDIILFEGYPENYATYALRLHRWMRGDWQLLPWLLSKVPSANGVRLQNTLATIDRWKIADNLRRSLCGPLFLVLLVLGWVWLPGSPALWTLGILGLLLAPTLPQALLGPRMRVENTSRSALAITFLAYEASVVVDAMTRVLVRKAITGKKLLEWTSAAHAAFGIHNSSQRMMFWRTMRASPLLAIAIGALILVARPAALVAASPLLLLWSLAPEIARFISKPRGKRVEHTTERENRKLRLLARRTWRFFDAFVGPNDQWLPVDNYQEEPREQTAHRTSPTNIGLMLVATLTAYDFGYIGPSALSLRVRRVFDSISRMRHYQGHLLNWYDTKNLQPLLPWYVSTVDSGNFAGCLLALKHGCREVALAPVVRVEIWEGLTDSVDLLEEVVDSVRLGKVESLRAVIARMRQATQHACKHLDDAHKTLIVLTDETSAELDKELLIFLKKGAHRHEADLLHSLRTSIDRLHQQLQHMRRELDLLLPWLGLREDALAFAIQLPFELRLDEIPDAARGLRDTLRMKEKERAKRGESSEALDASAKRLHNAFDRAEENAKALTVELLALATRADEEVRGMDFKLLYDAERKLFRIGYNATNDQVDPHYYDLLASEARLASYVAIVKRDVPESHWYALGRPMTLLGGSPLLLSWGGTMFEYLMPTLLMKSQDDTLLSRTYRLVVETQINYARQNHEPWGISESAYARVDADHTYQYRSFGVPGLGFKRGLEEDRVITPYASILAVSIKPRAVINNLAALEGMGMLGTYGLFEALDLTPGRSVGDLPGGQPFLIVRSYMAHHQGMLLIALGNYLCRRSMVQRFHADAMIETGDALLNEQAPHTAPAEWPIADAGKNIAAESKTTPHAPEPWMAVERGGPQAFVLSNGRLTSLLTASGGGGLRWKGLALTRYEPDITCDEDGYCLYVRDEESRRVWRATSTVGRTTYAMHKAELHYRNEGISVRVDVTVAPADDVEVRQITLHNETNRKRTLSVASAGRPVLLDATRAPTHPAFSSMFIESEFLAELDALLFERRPQTPNEEPAVLVHRLVYEGSAVALAGYESDRAECFVRGAGAKAAPSFGGEASAFHGRTGTVIDPIMSLIALVTIEPKGSVTLAFVTTIGRSHRTAVELARKYGSMHAVRWAFRDAAQESPRRLTRSNVEASLLPTIQRLFSALLYCDPTLRVSSRMRAMTPPCQRRLWGRGISGDDPIVLIRVHDANAPLVRECIAAQRYLRSCGVRLELVFVDQQASGYETEGSGSLRSVFIENQVEEWLNRHGGLFVVAADRVSEDEIRHLEACARIVLDTRERSLIPYLQRAVDSPPKLPQFEATLMDVDAAEQPRPRPRLLFDNGTGGFSEDGREYVLEVAPGASTPAPWCNVLANEEFGCLVSESSLGPSWSLNAGENRLTPWRNDPVFDIPSEALYLRDEETAAVWSTTPLPAGQSGQTLIRHGAGYTTYERESHGLVQEMTVFVPPGAGLKIVRLRLKNTLERHRRLTATYYVEWVLGSRREAQRPYLVSEVDRDHACLLATCGWNEEFAGRVAFLASMDEMHGCTADRTEFLGRGGDYAFPEALSRWGLSGQVDTGADPCAALQVHLELSPGEERETHFLVGQSKNRDDALALISRFHDTASVEIAWKELHAYWDGILGNIRVKTPEPAMDLLLNRWLLYQALSSRIFGRTGFYQSSGAFGYRDQLQDVMALFHAAPSIARAHILEAARHQFEEGDVLHWWHPPLGRGVRTRCSDDLAWLPYVTAEYVTATGDTAILDEPVGFLLGEPLRPDEHDRYAHYETSAVSASLYEHCRRAVERALTEGVHGLPLMGDGDWNDGMSRIGVEGRGESVWLGWFLCSTMDGFAALASRQNDKEAEKKWTQRATLLRARIRDVAWDGEWYLRAFHDDGSLVGSATSHECAVDSIAQSWAVLAREKRGSEDPRGRASVLSADKMLVREKDRLVLLFWPPFDSVLHDPGYVRAYPPGVRENGGQYTHAAAWLGFAHAALGDGAAATRIFDLLNPILRTRTASEVTRYRVEPYALAGDIYSCPPWVGRGGWTWYTGAAAWTWRLGVESILGLHKDDGALRIDPCIPPSWKGFEAWVQRGAQTLHITVENPDGVSMGIVKITQNGALLASNRIELDPSAVGMLEVHVRMSENPSHVERSAAVVNVS